MYKKCTFQFQWWCLYSDWWGCDGLTIGPSNGQRIYGRTWNCISSWIKWSCQKMEILCQWHLCLHQVWFDWICFVCTEFVSWTKYHNRLLFLNVLFIRDYEKITTIVFRKDTLNGLYLHWESSSQISWKRTLKSLISKAYMICSNFIRKSLLEKELEH